MRSVLALVAVVGCSARGMSSEQRELFEDFRKVEQQCLYRFEILRRDVSIHLSADDELGPRIKAELLNPWREMRDRVEPKLGDDELDRTLRRYFEEREAAWHAFVATTLLSNGIGTVDSIATYRDQNEAATADAKLVEAALAKLGITAPPPIVPDAPVVFQAPPSAPSGAAYILVADTVVLVDDAGFRVVATEVEQMDVAPDGTMWACGLWRVVRWDGKQSTVFKPKIHNELCAVQPDGKLLVFDEDLDDKGRDRLGTFDGKTWTITSASIGQAWDRTEQLIVARDGVRYALNRSRGGGGDKLLAFTGGAWKQIDLGESVSTTWTEQMFRGDDGNVWLFNQVTRGNKYPLALMQLTPAGVKPPVFVDTHFQTSELLATVDTTGLATVLDLRTNLLVQGTKQRKLAMPTPRVIDARHGPGPFAFDGAGRLWIDLVDGLNVIDQSGKRTVFPRGSIDVVRQPITQVIVVGGGPKLPAPGPVPTRTIIGTVENSRTPITNLDVVMCGETSGDPCPEGLPSWTATTDANGRFTFSNVPRWKYELEAHVGPRGDRHWRYLRTDCCAQDKAELEPASLAQQAIY